MFFNRPNRDELYTRHIAELKEAYEKRHAESIRVIKALADEVEFLRAKHYGPGTQPVTHSVSPVKARPEPDVGTFGHQFFLNEDEEDILALKDGGFIDAVEADQALAQLRAATGGVPIQVDQS